MRARTRTVMLDLWNPDRSRSVAAFCMRGAFGVVFLYHGYPKLAHSAQWTVAFVHMGFPPYFAYIAGVLETCGGALLIAGLCTRASALFLAGEMTVALVRVDIPSGSITQVGNYQLSLVLAAGAFALAAFGPGGLSADRFIRLWRSGVDMPQY